MIDFAARLTTNLRALVQARRLPYLCPSCGTRANHAGTHWTPTGRTCHTAPAWTCDLPEPITPSGEDQRP